MSHQSEPAHRGGADHEVFDVVVVGSGPVGLAMAALADQLGLRCALIERHRDLYALPRAGHVDHEIVRLFQSLGIADARLADSYPTTEYVWVNAAGETIMEFDWGARGLSGYNSDYMQFQPVFEAALSARIDARPGVAKLSGWEVQGVTDRGDAVEARLARTVAAPDRAAPVATDETRVVRGRYLIAADGANSGIRRGLGIERDDFGFNERWLVVDARKRREIAFDFDCGQICDPRRPVTVLPLGKRHRRWEWALLPGETAADLERPEAAWRLLAERGLGPDDVEIIRQLVYTFEARHAREWSRGRVFLAGDAAHTMPPFMGQGMCSGLRDAKNLVWKLDLVLRGVCSPALLATYEAERSPHSRDWTLISLEAGKVPCTLDPAEAERRDALFRTGWKPPMPDFPKLGHGVVARCADGRPAPLAGTLSLQAPVSVGGEPRLLDDHFPAPRFAVISVAGDPAAALTEPQRAAMGRVGVHWVAVGPAGEAPVEDSEGAYAAWFAGHGIEAAICRPDYYLFGAAASLSDLPALVDELLGALHVLETAAPPALEPAHADG